MKWYNSNWKYANIIEIDNTNNSDALTDYQKRIDLDSSNFDFSLANSDGSDIRFCDDSGNTLIPHWTKNWDSAGETANIFVKVPSIPANGKATIYMYYGNAGAVSTSSIGDTAKNGLGDDFLGTSLDTSKWNTSDTVDVSDSKLTLDGGENVYSVNVCSEKSILEIEFELPSLSDSGWHTYESGWYDYSNSTDRFEYMWLNDDRKWRLYYPGGNTNYLGTQLPVIGSYHLKSWVTESKSKMELSGDLTDSASITGTYTLQNSNVRLNGGHNAQVKYDWVFVREYTNPEPTFTVGDRLLFSPATGEFTMNFSFALGEGSNQRIRPLRKGIVSIGKEQARGTIIRHK